MPENQESYADIAKAIGFTGNPDELQELAKQLNLRQPRELQNLIGKYQIDCSDSREGEWLKGQLITDKKMEDSKFNVADAQRKGKNEKLQKVRKEIHEEKQGKKLTKISNPMGIWQEKMRESEPRAELNLGIPDVMSEVEARERKTKSDSKVQAAVKKIEEKLKK